MPLFSTKETLDYTPVSNRFIRDYMFNAPGDYVKVYLYGLLCITENSDIDFSGLCAALHMPYDNVIAAYEYWQQQGLIKIYNGNSIRFEYLKPSGESSEILYTEREYNITLQKLFGSRILSSGDYQKIYEYTDTFHLSREVVLLMLEYCIKLKGKNISFSYIDKIAKTWADEGIGLVEADKKISIFEAKISDAGKILGYIGIKDRLPTDEEIILSRKWKNDWGFSLDAIKSACAKTSAARNPSMKYLDAILKSLYEKGFTTSNQIHSLTREKEETAVKIKEIMHTIGLNDLTVSPEHIVFYKKWSETFPEDAILMAAKQMVKYSNKSFAYLDKILENWKQTNLVTPADISHNMQENAQLNKELGTVFSLAGIKKRIVDADRQKYLQWKKEWGFEDNVIHLACEISSVTENPYKYLNRLLSIWHEKNIKTFEQASHEAKKPLAKLPAENKKNNAESLKYIQRDYKNEDFSNLFYNLDNDVEES